MVKVRGLRIAGQGRLIVCPKCGYRFDLTYARAYSCQSCPILIEDLHCSYVKCPRCGYEFPLR